MQAAPSSRTQTLRKLLQTPGIHIVGYDDEGAGLASVG